MTKVEFTITNLNKKDHPYEKKETEFKAGRYPVWNLTGSSDIQLGDLTFESDLRLVLMNQKKGVFGGLSNMRIAELAVPLHSLLKRNMKPQFFNLLSSEGQFVG